MEATDHDLKVLRAMAITRRKGGPSKVLGGNAESWLPRQLRCVRVAAHAVRWSFEAARKFTNGVARSNHPWSLRT